jgi:hypothetical protein
MKQIAFSTTLALAAAAPFALHGADFSDDPNRFSLGARFGLNFKADFQNSAAFNNPAVNPGPATGGAEHTYDDGYVLVDSSGDAGGLTSNWGYQHASQVAGDTMQFHAIQPDSHSSATGNPQYGGEFVYQRAIGSLPLLSSGDWGFEFGFGFTDLDLRDNRNGTVPVTTDTYQLNGLLPPGAPYKGTFTGPGFLLGDTPARSFTSATVTGYQKLSGQLFSFRLGPFAEWNLTSKLSLAGSVGVTLAPTTVDYDFSETYTLADGSAYASSGHSDRSKLLYGPFVGVMLRYDFNANWGVYVGAQFQSLTDLEQSVGSRTASFDPGTTVYATIGVSWRF